MWGLSAHAIPPWIGISLTDMLKMPWLQTSYCSYCQLQ